MINEHKIFEEVRKTPTELTEQHVVEMIDEFPAMPLQPLDEKAWTKLLTLKNITRNRTG